MPLSSRTSLSTFDVQQLADVPEEQTKHVSSGIVPAPLLSGLPLDSPSHNRNSAQLGNSILPYRLNVKTYFGKSQPSSLQQLSNDEDYELPVFLPYIVRSFLLCVWIWN